MDAFPYSVFIEINVNLLKLSPEIKNYMLTERGFFFV
jgi:hypothetical protein